VLLLHRRAENGILLVGKRSATSSSRRDNSGVQRFADGQQLTAFRCFTRADDNVHVVFGPASFFKPPTQQGPTSFKEKSGPTVVTFPLYRGTSRGRAVQYVITHASDLGAAHAPRVNYVPRLAQAMGTDAVQTSRSRRESGNRIDFPASLDFSPAHMIVPSATGFPPAAAAPGAVGEPATARQSRSHSATTSSS
jgi:hypothetical protein